MHIQKISFYLCARWSEGFPFSSGVSLLQEPEGSAGVPPRDSDLCWQHPGSRLGEPPSLRRSGPHRGSGGSSGSTINFGVMFVHLSSHRKSFSIRLVPGSGSTGPHCCLFWFLSSSSTRFGFTNEDGPKGVLVLIHLRRVALFLGHCWSCCWAS